MGTSAPAALARLIAGGVTRTANAPVSGRGDATADAIGEERGELLAFVEGDAVEIEPLAPHPAMSRATANTVVERFTAGIIYSNGVLRMELLFRYHPASKQGPPLTPRSLLEGVRNDGRHLLSVLFYLVGGIVRTLNLAEVTSHLV